MIDNLVTALSADGYAIIRNVLEPADFDLVEPEFARLLATRAADWRATGRLAMQPAPHIQDLRTGLLHLSKVPGFDSALLAELDVTLPHAPFAVVRPHSPFHVGPGLLRLVSSPRLLSVIQQVVGPDITLSPNGHARYKPPSAGSSGVTPWHRDAMTHHPDSDRVTVITCWVPMHDVNEDSGCLVVVPGGHHTHARLAWPLTPEVVVELDRLGEALPVRKGDIVLLDKNVPHASLPNRSDDLRWSFDLRYYPSAEASDRPWFPSLEVLAGGAEPDPTPDPEEWRLRWERTRELFASTGRLVPGRREYARAVADDHIRLWEAETYPHCGTE